MPRKTSRVSATLFIVGLLATTTFGFAFEFERQLLNKKLYVALDGNDSSPGTMNRPFRTIKRALGALGAGDTLYLRAGTYLESVDFNNTPVPSGRSLASAVTVQAYPGEIVIIQAPSGAAIINLDGDVHHTVWKDLVLDADNVQYGVILTNGAHHNRFQNVEVKYAKQSGIIASEGSGGTDFNEFIKCKSHNNGTSVLHHGLSLATSDNLVISGEFYNNVGYGVHLYNDSSTVNRNTIRQVRAYNNGMYGVTLASGNVNLIVDNLIYNNARGGIEVNWGTGTTDTKLYNNTLYHNGGPGIVIGSNTTNAIVRNNLLFLNSHGMLDFGKATLQSNNFDNPKVDPKFVDAASFNFALQADSPAIDAGVTIPEASVDIDGVVRPQGLGFDIGSYEFKIGSPRP